MQVLFIIDIHNLVKSEFIVYRKLRFSIIVFNLICEIAGGCSRDGEQKSFCCKVH